MIRGLGIALTLAAVLYVVPARATDPPAAPQPTDENKDLELIPAAAREPSRPPTPHTAGPQRRYLESAFTLAAQRGGLIVPPPPPAPFNWQERLLLDVREEWRLGERVQLAYSSRLNLRAENDIAFPGRENLIHDLRELYLSTEPAERSYLDIGRINLKSGVALGFNPTDFFKTRAVVEPLSVDPTVLREDRLGTLMVRAEHIWEHGSLTAAFAPALQRATPLYTNLDLPSVDPMLDRTNAANRMLLKLGADRIGDVSPEVLAYHEGDATRFGTNLTANLGQRTVAYLEWSGGRRGSLIDEALRFGRDTGTLPPQAASVLPASGQTSFASELALGASYTAGTHLTLNLEYHFDQSAFGALDWSSWFAVGEASRSNVATLAELWLIRGYALEQQQPVSRHSVFLRADCMDAWVPKLELAGFVDVDVHDGSTLMQLSADYYVSDQWTVGALAVGELGGRRSDFGSGPQAAGLLMKVVRYF